MNDNEGGDKSQEASSCPPAHDSDGHFIRASLSFYCVKEFMSFILLFKNAFEPRTFIEARFSQL